MSDHQHMVLLDSMEVIQLLLVYTDYFVVLSMQCSDITSIVFESVCGGVGEGWAHKKYLDNRQAKKREGGGGVSKSCNHNPWVEGIISLDSLYY